MKHKTKKRKPWNPHPYLVAAARRVWRWSPQRRQVYEEFKERGLFRCALCNKLRRQVAADHIIPVGKQPRRWGEWGLYLEKLFEGSLQLACKKCHQQKTNRERKEMREAA